MSESRGIRALFDIRPRERGIAAWMSTYFFLVITSFWILKPLKKTLFIGFYTPDGLTLGGRDFAASEAELIAKVLNMGVAAVAVTLFSLLARRLRRQQLSYVFTSFFLVSYGLFAQQLEAPSAGGVWSFYLFGDLFSTLMVATFFAFLNDSVSPDMAKRLYGVVGFGGVLGGVVGASAVGVLIGSLSLRSWLGVAALLGLAILAVAWAASRAVYAAEAALPRAAVPPAAEPPRQQGNPALVGARLVFRSGYLLSIVAIVGLYELVSTVLDFQFTSAVVEFTEGRDEQRQAFASIYAITNWLSMSVQLLLTSFIMRRLGLSVALLILPAAIGLSSLGFLLLPSLWLGGLLSIADNGLSYSLNQSSKEALYVPTTAEEKYQAKAFIDMFVQRFAKALGVGLGLLVATQVEGFAGIRQLSLFVLPVLGVWAFAAHYAGRRFAQLEQSPPETGGGHG